MGNEKPNTGLFTLAIWDVKPGNEDAFIKAWEGIASWTLNNVIHSGQAYLLRDSSNPSKFVSFGPWQNESQISQWREQDEFKKFIQKTKELCNSGQPQTMKIAATVGH